MIKNITNMNGLINLISYLIVRKLDVLVELVTSTTYVTVCSENISKLYATIFENNFQIKDFEF